MARFDHPNVMKLLGVSISKSTTLLVIMPYMAQGSLLTFLRKNRDELTFDVKESLQLQTQVKLMLLCTVATCSFFHAHRLAMVAPNYCPCACKWPKGWSIYLVRDLFTVTWQQGTACKIDQ